MNHTESGKQLWLNQTERGKQFWIIVSLTQSCLMVLINGILICIIARKRALYQQINNMILISLMVVHFCSGCFGIFQYIFREQFKTYSIFKASEVALCAAAFYCLAIVTLDRLIAVNYAYMYMRINQNHLGFCFGVGFIIYGIIFVLALTYQKVSSLIFSTAFTFTSIFLAASNLIIYRQVKRQLRAIMTTLVAEDKKKREEKKRLYKRQKKSLLLSFFNSFLFYNTFYSIINVYYYPGISRKIVKYYRLIRNRYDIYRNSTTIYINYKKVRT